MESRKVTAILRKRILKEDNGGRIWILTDFPGMPRNTVAQTLRRLANEGVLVRYARGLYYRPVETILGRSVPSKEKVAEAIARSQGKKVVYAGYSGYAALGLTTQFPGIVTLATDRPLRSKLISKRHVRNVVRTSESLIDPVERNVLDALRDINSISDTTPELVLTRIVDLGRKKQIDIKRLAKLALHGEPPRVRALLGAIGEFLRIDKKAIAKLRNSLNETTHYRIPVGKSLPTAYRWGVLA